MTVGEHVAQQGAAIVYTLLKCVVSFIYWALDR